MTKSHANVAQQGGYVLREQLGFKMSRVSRLMQQRLEAVLADEGMTRTTWCVISSIGLEGIRTPSGVADNLGVARPAVSRLIKTMSKDGLIQSALVAEDGRNRKLSLTEAGSEKLDVCMQLVVHNAEQFASKLSNDHLAQLHGVLDVILEGEDSRLDTL